MSSSDIERRDAEDPEPRSSGQAASPRQLARIVSVAVGGALAVVTLGLVLALWGLGLTGKISQSTSEVLDLVKLGFALVAGVGGTVGLVLAYQRHLIAVEAGQRERAKEAREDAKEAREEAKLFNERFGTAASQLASEQYAVKLAGVYAMAKLADDWDTGRQTCINVLCANLRRGYTSRPADDVEPAELLAFHDNQDFRHTVIAVIATRLRDPDSGWHRCSFDFRGAAFDGGDFRGAIFSAGTVDFRGATFTGGTVDFGSTTFSGSVVDFSSTTFSGGTVYFGSATFSSGTVTFGGARLSGGTVYFNRATFSGAAVSFRAAKFSAGIVYFGGATFTGGTVDFGSATFSGGTVDFSDATFTGGTVDFSDATFTSGTVDFSDATFTGGTVDFSEAPDFSVPPHFDFQPDAVPTGLLLPARPDPSGTP
ncbi:uncharacterized protein YjbI with pentapeptide repeats [Catenulispora sp. MAP5-51]|uniref:pentapeptide repeat-containing protein n=1 Tax=Catenulispora sp. MAP5-51 TaxID=3156298 RepID=UPI0035136763